MNRRGVALLTVLWLLALLSVVGASTLTFGRRVSRIAVNRIALTRGRWGAEGCLAVMMGSADAMAGVDSLDLGAGVWCRAMVEDPAAKVRLDIANGDLLSALVADPAKSAALLDWLDPDDDARAGGAEREWYQAARRILPRNGPLLSIEELFLVRGFDSATVQRLRPFVSVRGGPGISLNAAPLEVLQAIPGLEAAAPLIVARRSVGHLPRDLDDLLSALPANLRTEAMGRYAELQGRLRFAPERLVLHLEGHVVESKLVARTTVEVAPTDRRLAVLSREEW